MLDIEIAILVIIACGVCTLTVKNLGVLRVLTLATVFSLCAIIFGMFYFQGGSFVFGGFDCTVGIEHGIDGISLIIAFFLCVCGVYTLLFTTLNESHTVRTKYTIGFLSIAIVSALIITITKDVFNFYIFFELLNICICLIFANTHINSNKKNTLEYLLLGGVAAVFLVLAIEIIYIIFGSLNITAISHYGKIITANEIVLLKIATMFIILTSFLKLGVFPFTTWVRKIYTTCPNHLLTFYGPVVSATSVYLVIFFLYKVLHNYELIQFASQIITPFCLAGVVIFSIAAIKEKDMRVIMGYSTLAQIGYIYVCLVIPNVNTLTGGVLHLMHNVIAKFGMFVIIGAVYLRAKSYHITVMSGLGKNIPLGIAFCILAASLVGLPGTSGFVSKFYMFQGLVEEGRFVTIGVFVVGSVINILYMWNIVSLMYFPQDEEKKDVSIARFPQVVACGVAVVIVLFGFTTNFTLAKSRSIATEFLQRI